MKGLILMASALFVSAKDVPNMVLMHASEVIMTVSSTGEVTIPVSRERLEQIVAQPHDDFQNQRAYAHLALEIVRLRAQCAKTRGKKTEK